MWAHLAREIRKLDETEPALAELRRRMDGDFQGDCEEVRKAMRQAGATTVS